MATLTGTDGPDTLMGTEEPDSIVGADGDDSLVGADGDDTLSGGLGDDTLLGGEGDDVLRPGPGANQVADGGAGDDTLALSYDGTFSAERMRGGEGTDLLQLYAGAHLVGVFSAEASGFETLELKGGGFIKGDEADNVIDLSGFAIAEGSDKVNVFAYGGDDRLIGSAKGDELFGDAGDDTLEGGRGNDRLRGDDGVDTASYASAKAAVRVSLATAVGQDTGGADTDRLDRIENLIGSRFGDTLSGASDNNALSGGAGGDLLRGADGRDALDGGKDADVLYGEAGADTLAGGAGSDRLGGGAEADKVRGDVGDDTLTGGGAADTLRGGQGADVFLYKELADTPANGGDLITDLKAEDVIDLSGIDADSGTAGDQAFTRVAAFTGQASELTAVFDAGGGTTSLLMDVDGDGAADGAILAEGDQTGFGGFVL